MTGGNVDRSDLADTDELLSAVAEERRRTVLRTLADLDERCIGLEGLADRPAVDEAEASGRRLRLTLHHLDLPKLRACGLLYYDPARKRIERRDRETYRRLLSAVEPFRRPEHVSD